MATKAEKFKADAQRRANPPKKKRPARPRRDVGVDTSKPGVSASDRKAGGESTAARNASKRAASKGGARLEDSANGKPSRRSTRKSEGRIKQATSLTRKKRRAVRAPSTRAAKAQARRAKK
jgi:hypothetical protein